VRALKQPGDVGVASIHWGGNWGYRVPDEHRNFAHRLVERAGVDVVHGHSSHHPKGIEVHEDRPILYGCGDFINDYEGIRGYEESRDDLSLMYFPRLDRASGRLLALEMVPMQIRRFQLRRAAAADARWLAETLDRESAQFGCGVELSAEGTLILRWKSRSSGQSGVTP
jgi:poly-gamma-glutamate synthesis protein (capsule biosynthesis protein)